MKHALQAAERTETTDLEEQIQLAFERFAREVVGRVGLKRAQRLLRLSMHREALRQNHDSRRAAARILGVDRRFVQRLAKERSEAEARLRLAPPPEN